MYHNAALQLSTERVVLTPYRAEHVPRYHAWMQDEELLRLTASERLTLAEEYGNQQSWLRDPYKCTFIILDPAAAAAAPGATTAMAGDVNLFFTGACSDSPPAPASPSDAVCARNGGAEASVSPTRPYDEAEIEVMIAEPRLRRRGLATEALRVVMAYASAELGTRAFVAKVLRENAASVAMLQRVGFEQWKEVAVFDEVHMRRELTCDARAELCAWYARHVRKRSV